MVTLKGYAIAETLYESGTTLVVRGVRVSDRAPVVCKVLSIEYPSAHDLSSFRREYEIAAKLRGQGTATVYTLEEVGNSLAIIMEDFGGESLNRLQGAGVDERVLIAARIAEAVARIHRRNTIHKDINPSNIVRNPKTGMVKIIDFGIATELSRETASFRGVAAMEGTLPYISPEQTGRMNRPLDYRTDLYSLGITLWELFTGRLPFASDDPLELVYAHIAKVPQSPHLVRPDVPEAVAAIILKLLAKAPEDRYQSATGVVADLDRCVRELAERGRVDKFMLGEADTSDRFSIPNRLYGREAELSILKETFAEAVDEGCRLLLVAGAPGVGKTSLIQEIHKLLPARKGVLASGKFNPLETNVPYSAVFQAFRDLLGQLLCASAEVVSSCRQSILNALGSNAGVLVQLVPRLGQLLGAQEPPRALDPVAARNRLQLVVREFLRAFADRGYPVVLFLDDLQWSDPSTLDLLKYLLGSHGLTGLLIVGAYRDNEVREGHPLSLLLKGLADDSPASSPRVRQLEMKPLRLEDVNQLVADTLHRDPEDARALSTLIHGKTNGNPFFATQMLTSLHAQGAIAYMATENHWRWDLGHVAKAEVSDNVVEFLVQELQALSEQAKRLLKIAACIGHKFDLRTVVQAHGTAAGLGASLWETIEKGIIIPLDRSYRLLGLQEHGVDLSAIDVVFKFQHDRLVQAVQSMLSEEEQARIHHRIGQELLKVFRRGDAADTLFALVNHLNAGQGQICERSERVELAELNALAGRRAFAATAFKSAAQYFGRAAALLAEDDWASLPSKRFSLSLQLAESMFLAGDLGRAGELAEPLLELAHDKLEHASVHNLKSRILEFQGDLSGAIDEIRKGLMSLAISLPESQEEIERRVGEGLGRMQHGLARTSTEGFLALPEMTDPEKIMAMRLLAQVVPAAIQCNYPLYMVATMTMADLTLAHGITAESCKCIADCGIISSSVLGDYENGYRLGKVAFALIDRLKVEWQKPAVCFSFTYVSHMRKHFREGLDHYEMSYRLGMEVGDLQHATYARAHKVHLMFWVGANLEECRRETESTIAFLKESQGFVQLRLANIVLHAITKLQTTPTAEQAQEQAKADGHIMATVEQMRHVVLIGRFAQYNAFHHFLLGELGEAERWSEAAERLLPALGTDFPCADHFLVQSLLCVDKLKRSSADDRDALCARVSANLTKLEKLTDNCPENFAHKYHLVRAELSAAQGAPLEEVVEHYREALAAIGKREFPQMVALINEQQGKFWIARNSHTIARAFLREAHYHYMQWGALRKAEAMEREYRDYFAFRDELELGPPPGKNDGAKRRPRTANHALSNAALDITSIVKATQAISSEIRTEKLLRTLLQTIIENAGAQNGCLLLANESTATLDVVAQRGPAADAIEIVESTPYWRSPNLCREMVEYVERTRESVVLGNAAAEGKFSGNAYLTERRAKSVLCLPVIRQSVLKGVVYLENNLADHVFTTERLSVLTILAAQASISIENARLYEEMEDKVRERTHLLRQANVRLRELALVDPVTRLNNRRFFHDHITGVTEAYVRKLSTNGTENRNLSLSETVMGVFLIDIDHFKEVNDAWGHEVGDAVLVGISKTLKSLVRTDDFIVRWGGEEFLVILNKTDPAYLDRFARKLLQAVEAGSTMTGNDTVIHRTCSVGYGQIPFCRSAPEFLSLEQTIKLSDYAMYVAKQAGRNQAVCISPKEGVAPTEALRSRLMALSRTSPSDTSCIELRHVRGAE